MSTATPQLRASDVRLLRIVGALWPELVALFWYIVFLWTPLVRGWMAEHPRASGIAFFLFVYFTHRERAPSWFRR